MTAFSIGSLYDLEPQSIEACIGGIKLSKITAKLRTMLIRFLRINSYVVTADKQPQTLKSTRSP